MKGTPQAAASDSACVSVPAAADRATFFFLFGWDLTYSVAQAGLAVSSLLSSAFQVPSSSMQITVSNTRGRVWGAVHASTIELCSQRIFLHGLCPGKSGSLGW